MNVYYRSYVQGKLKLHCIAADGYETQNESINAVMKQLHDDMEVFVKPVLAVIKGGKD